MSELFQAGELQRGDARTTGSIGPALFLLLVLGGWHASAQLPGATLVVPSWEVSANGATESGGIPAGGADTNVHLANGSGESVLTHVSIFSATNEPALNFNIPLRPGDAVSFSMRDVLNGRLNVNAALQSPGGTDVCRVSGWNRFSNPNALDAGATTAAYRDPAFTGVFRRKVWDILADSPGAAAYSGSFRGSLTVDVVNFCTNQFQSEPGYWRDDAIATVRPGAGANVLTGSASGSGAERAFVSVFDPLLDWSVSPTVYADYRALETVSSTTAPAAFRFKGDGRSPQNASPLPRPSPIVFVHGFCSDAGTWRGMLANLGRISSQRYSSGNAVELYFDGTWVRWRGHPTTFYPDRGPGYETIPQGRLYTISFFDSTAGDEGSGFDLDRVRDIEIQRLGGQLAAVIAAVRSVNAAASVDVVSHSMGGLVSRSLVEGLSSGASSLEAFVPGSVRQVVTLDTPHSGFPKILLDLALGALEGVFSTTFPFMPSYAPCFAPSSVQKWQMQDWPLSGFLATLNDNDIPSQVPLTALATTGAVSKFLGVSSDGVVSTSSQNIKTIDRYRCAPNVITIPKTVPGLLAHSRILGLMDTALIVDSAVSALRIDAEGGGCRACSPSSAVTLALPGLAQAAPGARTLVLDFGASGADGLAGLEPTTCAATIVARADDGGELARQEVLAVGIQVVQFGILPAGGWHFELLGTCRLTVSSSVQYTPASSFGSASAEAVLPIVLDVETATAHFTTETSIVNSGDAWAMATLKYTPALGSREGEGSVTERLSPGSQLVISDTLGYLRQKGLRIPPATSGQQGGTLQVAFSGARTTSSVAVTARTMTATAEPQPVGAAGLAYAGISPAEGSETALTVPGLRSDARDRSNVAVYNPSIEPVAVRMTVFAGDGTGRSAVVRESLGIPSFGWTQVSNVFADTGITNGWVDIQRVSAAGRFGAYGVINDNATNDGSFVVPTTRAISGNRMTVPVLVETAAFRSELVLTNRSDSRVTLTLDYVESASPSLGAGGRTSVTLAPRTQRIVADAIEFLRASGAPIGERGAGTYAGCLRITVDGAPLSDVFAGARTASLSPAGGQFGLFTPCIYGGQEPTSEAFLFGLRADAENRSNVAVANVGPSDAGLVSLEVRTFDGDLGGTEVGSAATVTLAPGQWYQYVNFLKVRGIESGWVKVTRTGGTAPWIAYGVINDGGSPGERTGDGAYVPPFVRGPGGN